LRRFNPIITKSDLFILSCYGVFLFVVLQISFIIIAEFELPNITNHFAYANPDDFHFAAVGDWGCKKDTVEMVSNIVDKNPELVLGLGDFSYGKTPTCWFDIISPIDDITRINIGNHEDKTAPVLKEYLDHFDLESQYYSYDYESIHFLTISTEIPFHNGTPQYNFMQRDLELASQNPEVKWIIVNFHRHIYGTESSLDNSRRQILHPLFDKYDVDLVLQGHDHNYQRTFPIKYNAMNSYDPIITDRNLTDYINPDGIVMVTVGTGGHSLWSPNLNSSFVSFKQDSSFGFLDVKIINNGTKLEGSFYANDDTIKDTFRIIKTVGNNN
jgi:hypothetical protein